MRRIQRPGRAGFQADRARGRPRRRSPGPGRSPAPQGRCAKPPGTPAKLFGGLEGLGQAGRSPAPGAPAGRSRGRPPRVGEKTHGLTSTASSPAARRAATGARPGPPRSPAAPTGRRRRRRRAGPRWPPGRVIGHSPARAWRDQPQRGAGVAGAAAQAGRERQLLVQGRCERRPAAGRLRPARPRRAQSPDCPRRRRARPRTGPSNERPSASAASQGQAVADVGERPSGCSAGGNRPRPRGPTCR